MDQTYLVIELLAHSNPDQAIEFAKASENQGIQRVVSKTLGEKNQWYFSDFRGFLEVYYTSVLTSKAIKYLSPRNCFAWALREGNLELAEFFFQYWLIVEPEYLNDLSDFSPGFYSDACLSRDPEVLTWLIKHFTSHSKKIPKVSFRDVHFAVRSGNVAILETILSKVRNMSLFNDDLIYYTCLSDSPEMFQYVRSHFDLTQKHVKFGNDYQEKKEDFLEDDLDWNLVYTCALNTKADTILKTIEDRQIEVQYVKTSGLPPPINPQVYDLYSKFILESLNDETELYEFFQLVESNLDGRGPQDRYLVLKKINAITQTSGSPQIIDFRNNLINEAIWLGFVNIASFFRNLGYSADPPFWVGGKYDWGGVVPQEPVSQYWYRKSSLLLPESSLDFKRYLISYHRLNSDDDDDPFTPTGVSIDWIVDQLLVLEELDNLDLHTIMNQLKEDHRFDPNYRLLDLIEFINLFGEHRRNQLLRELLEDPRIDLRNLELRELASDAINEIKINTVMDIHLRKHLTRHEKIFMMKNSFVFGEAFSKYYQMSHEDLANDLNIFQVPWIPHFNSLIAAMFLSGYDPERIIGQEKSERLAPASTLIRIRNVITLMKAKDLYYPMLYAAVNN
ncbi:Hypothetical protein POVR1_LOCUS308 [uncultured virus]|nr:Hypothetical protein POVR1_LOCUS308 [uncultured virus]